MEGQEGGRGGADYCVVFRRSTPVTSVTLPLIVSQEAGKKGREELGEEGRRWEGSAPRDERAPLANTQGSDI